MKLYSYNLHVSFKVTYNVHNANVQCILLVPADGAIQLVFSYLLTIKTAVL